MPTPPDTAVARRARADGAAIRAGYAARLDAVVREPVDAPRALPCEVVAFSSQDDLPEQVASIRSLLRHAGRPERLRVCSDGTHTAAARRLLEAVDPCVTTEDAPPGDDAMLRKLALETTLGARPTIYTDADVLFMDGADVLAGLLDPAAAPGWFLQDCEPYLDDRLVDDRERTLPPVNGGFQVLLAPLGWDDALRRLPPDPVFHTEQTLLHLAMHAAGARALDPDAFVVSTDDLRSAEDELAGPHLALRHYTTPVRHKFWQTLGATFLRRT